MYINEECLRITDVKPLEYVSWCKTTKNKVNSRDSKRKFFELIREGKLYRDKKTKKIMYRGKEIGA